MGYLTLDEEGLILRANLSAATLLGQNRSSLLQHAFTRFIFSTDQDRYYLRHGELLISRGTPSSELRAPTARFVG